MLKQAIKALENSMSKRNKKVSSKSPQERDEAEELFNQAATALTKTVEHLEAFSEEDKAILNDAITALEGIHRPKTPIHESKVKKRQEALKEKAAKKEEEDGKFDELVEQQRKRYMEVYGLHPTAELDGYNKQTQSMTKTIGGEKGYQDGQTPTVGEALETERTEKEKGKPGINVEQTEQTRAAKPQVPGEAKADGGKGLGRSEEQSVPGDLDEASEAMDLDPSP